MRMERKHPHIPEGSGLDAVHFGPDGLGGILDKDKAALFAQGGNGGHVGHIAIKVHDHHGPAARRKHFFNAFGGNHAAVQVHIGPDESGALLDVGVGRGREGV